MIQVNQVNIGRCNNGFGVTLALFVSDPASQAELSAAMERVVSRITEAMVLVETTGAEPAT
jgi:hypothetical protein